jgi:kumamolisin
MTKNAEDIPASYQRLAGSERRPSSEGTLLGAADLDESFSVTIVLRRRPDGPPLPDHSHFATTPPSQRQRLPADEFAARYGAAQEDIDRVTAFAREHGLTVVEANAARRAVVVSGTTRQMNQAFAVTLGRYQHEITPARNQQHRSETYRGRDGFVHIPTELAGIILGVFGLDNRTISKHNGGGDPPNTTALTVPQVSQLYGYPTHSAAGQTIGILSLSGYAIRDIQLYFAGLPAGYTMPAVQDVLVHGTNPGSDPYGETTQDIAIAASFAPGSAINVYITSGDQLGWVDLIQRVAHPSAGDTPCSVLSCSWYIANGDDAATLAAEGVTTAFSNAVSAAFQDAALQGVTVCIASGDTGSNSKVQDGRAHVQYPGSDPWVLAVGGTTIGNISGSSFDEYVWNDPDPADPAHWGTTGGGVSDLFALPSYQSGAGVPPSVNDKRSGRGVPDVAGNASLNSGYSGLFLNGNPTIGNGTSAAAPQWAGLIAVINAELGQNVGFVNPVLYTLGSGVFRDITPPPGPADNSNGGVSGYPAGPGWDACTGWGSPKGAALLAALQQHFGSDKVASGKEENHTLLNAASHGKLP